MINSGAPVDVVNATVTTREGWTRYNAHYHDSEDATLTNRTGGGVVDGDVAAVSTANDSSVVLADVLESMRPFAVARATIANTASGQFTRSGIVTVRNQGAVIRGNYLIKSATSLAVQDSGIPASIHPPRGAVAIALASASGSGTVAAWWLGRRLPAGRIEKYRDATNVDVVDTTDETLLHTQSIPLGVMGTTGILVTQILMDATQNIGGLSASMRVKFDGSTAMTFAYNIPQGTNINFEWYIYICQRDSVSSQYYTALARKPNDLGTLNVAMFRGTTAVDFSAAREMTITMQHVSPGAYNQRVFYINTELLRG